ncbi:MAG: serine hydrolase domain-containing protein [Bacteroidota bacterium]
MKNLLAFLLCSFLLFPFTLKGQKTVEKELEALFASEIVDDGPGGSVLLLKGEEVVFLKNFGLADLKSKEKITENSIFNTGSISKTFVANAILILHERGELSIEDGIDKYFPDFKDPSLSAKVKIKHLLSHSSGLPDIRKVSENPAFFLTAKDEENWAPIKQAAKLVFQPGEQFQYSNPAFNGLALIIEKVSGQSWQSFVKENIFEPAGMRNSTITNGQHPQKGVAHAYVQSGKIFQESDYGEVPTFAAAGNGGIWSSVLELAKYEKALRNHVFLSESLTEESREVLRHENWTQETLPFLGYGWFIGNKDGFGVNYVYHTGSQGGFRAFYVSVPDKDLLFIGLFNKPSVRYRNFIEEGLAIFKKYDWLE